MVVIFVAESPCIFANIVNVRGILLIISFCVFCLGLAGPSQSATVGWTDAQERVDATYADQETWIRQSILNTATSGRFSTDRTMRDYNADIWRLAPLHESK